MALALSGHNAKEFCVTPRLFAWRFLGMAAKSSSISGAFSHDAEVFCMARTLS